MNKSTFPDQRLESTGVLCGCACHYFRRLVDEREDPIYPQYLHLLARVILLG
jgi:hypothetical protein